MLISIIPRQTSPHRQRLQVYLWTGVIVILYSVLISLFRLKNRGKAVLPVPYQIIDFDAALGYPFRLLL
jgi:hypothetical protein